MAWAAWAVRRGPSLNKLMQELSVRALTEHDAEMRFRMRAAWGDSVRGLTVLDDLDRRHAEAFIEKLHGCQTHGAWLRTRIGAVRFRSQIKVTVSVVVRFGIARTECGHHSEVVFHDIGKSGYAPTRHATTVRTVPALPPL